MSVKVGGLSAALVLVLAGPAAAQTTAQFPIQFDFLNPGARSLGLGSAFIGLADDASSAFTNPAGLLNLSRPEFSFEGRYRRFETSFLERGRVSGVVQNLGEDTVSGPVYADDLDSRLGASFISFVYPKQRWAVALYRHELSNISNEYLYRGVFERNTVGVIDDRNRDIPLRGSREIEIANYGATVAARLSPAVTVGGGVSLYTFKLDSSAARVGVTGGLFGPPDLSVTGSTSVQEGDEPGVGVNLGLQVRASPTVSFGAVYRRGPTFEFTQTDKVSQVSVVRTGDFKVPDSFGLGLAWRPADVLLATVDYVRVRHGQLKKDFVDFQAFSTGTEDQLTIEDVNEIHLGLEYTLRQVRMTPALRVGYWRDPDHTVKYVSDGTNNQSDVRFQFILPGGSDQNHYTVGLGLPVSRKLELNAGADFSGRATYVSASAIIRFF